MTVTQPLTAATFGELLRHLRKRMQMTQQELGIALGYSTAQIARLEGGERLPDVALVKTTYVEALGLEHEPELAAQLIALATAARDVRPTAPSARMNNLPTQLTRFIGRQREVAEVKRLVASHRLVTLSGAGGVGKTRLAQHAGQDLLGDYADGVWLVEYAPLMDAGLVVATCVVSLDLSEQPSRTLLEILLTYLKEKKAVIIFDNCEHLISACAEFAEALLRGCPDIHILATSREPLGVPGEVVWRVPSMQTPDPAHLPSLSRIRQHEAIQLFYSIATAARSDFVLNEDNMAAVAQICSRVDGIPLAIEMAAAQVAELSEHEIAVGLAYGLALLSSGSRVALPRHRTLRATLDWSYSLLSESERILLARLSVFAGGWTAKAAQAICADDPLATPDVLPALLQLARKSLVTVTMQNHHTRYHLLETIRQYAMEKLRERGETNGTRERHLTYYVGLTEGMLDIGGYRYDAWVQRVEPEHDNGRAAFNWARERADTDASEMMLRVASALSPMLRRRRSLTAEGLAWLIEALAQGSHAPKPVRARAMLAKACLLDAQGDDGDAVKVAEEGLALCSECDDLQGSAMCLLTMAADITPPEDPRIVIYAEQALELFRQVGCQDGEWRCFRILGLAALLSQQATQAETYFTEALHITREMRDNAGTIRMLNHMFHIDRGRAVELLVQEMGYQRQNADSFYLASCLHYLGTLYLELGQYDQAIQVLDEGIALLKEMDLSERRALPMYANCISCLGIINYLRGNYDQAIERFERAAQLHSEGKNTDIAIVNHCRMAAALLAQGHFMQAQEILRHALPRFHENRQVHSIRLIFRLLANTECRKGRLTHSARLIGSADEITRRYNPPDFLLNTPLDDTKPSEAVARAQLGDAAYEAEYAIGQAMTVDEAVAYALEG